MCDRMNSFQVVVRLRSGAGARLWRRRNVAYGLIRDLMAQICHRTYDTVVAPAPVLPPKTEHERLHLR